MARTVSHDGEISVITLLLTYIPAITEMINSSLSDPLKPLTCVGRILVLAIITNISHCKKDCHVLTHTSSYKLHSSSAF